VTQVRDRNLILRFNCPDRPGILAAVTRVLFEQGCDIRDAAQFGDAQTGRFFVRIHLAAPPQFDDRTFRGAFNTVAGYHAFDWSLSDLARKPRVLIAVSQHGHCLQDLLHRWQAGLLPMDIVGVVSNHELLQPLVEWHRLPFRYLPVNPENKERQEKVLLEMMQDSGTELLVLARYMQILTQGMCEALQGRCINIHHSFLPGFKGARPYERAHERGVRLIGATAHYVTADLDEGPIIEQDVRRVNHATTAQEMANLGREIEASVLARAVRWHVEHRIMLNGNKTVVLV
jgi:formyltetrahydrofolate deformylase